MSGLHLVQHSVNGEVYVVRVTDGACAGPLLRNEWQLAGALRQDWHLAARAWHPERREWVGQQPWRLIASSAILDTEPQSVQRLIVACQELQQEITRLRGIGLRCPLCPLNLAEHISKDLVPRHTDGCPVGRVESILSQTETV